MINNPKVSVIVPVYNTEKYISECIESIINQSYKNLEILLIDDESKDESRAICEKYALIDNRITVVEQKNQGAAKARNTGIKRSTGDYIIFIDSDDYWDDMKCIEKMIINLKKSNADILKFGYKKYFEDKDLIEIPKYEFNRDYIDFNSKKNTLTYLAKYNLINSSPCNKIVKRDFIINNKIFFREGITSEDIDWNARLIILADKFDVINGNIYVYRQRKGSVTHSISYKSLEQLLDNIKQCITYIDIYNISNYNFFEEYMNYVAYQYMTLLVAIQISKIDIDKNMLSTIKEYRYLLNYDMNYRVNIFKNINKYCGFYLLNKFIKVYLNLKGVI